MSTTITLGIDISKAFLDTYILPAEKHKRYDNTAAGIAELLKDISKEPPAHIVLEPTGGYEQDILLTMQSSALPVSMINARQIRDYARACGIMAKTDKCDARVLADYGRRMKPEPSTPIRPECKELKTLINRREQLVLYIKQERCVREKTACVSMCKMIDSHLRILEKQKAKLDNMIEELVKNVQSFARKAEILKSCKGIGPHIAHVLLAYLPELGSLDCREIAALAGLAPRNRDSGTWRGQRTIGGGRKQVRQALYLGALSASRHNPDISAFYCKKKSEGMKPKPALIAAARKLLLVLNALIRDNRAWTP